MAAESESPRFEDGYDEPSAPEDSDDDEEEGVVMEVRLPPAAAAAVRTDAERVVAVIEQATARRLDHSLPDRAARIRTLVQAALDTQSVEALLAYLAQSGWLNERPASDHAHARARAMALLRVDLELAVLRQTSVWPRTPRGARGGRKRRVLVVRKRKRIVVDRTRARSD